MTSSFAALGVPADLVRVLDDAGISDAFPIQGATLPDALAGRDICGRAPTGSGKTLAFSIPVVARTGRSKPGRPKALILVPTRELAAQVRDTIVPLARARRRWVVTFYGGTSVGKDVARLRKGVDIAVATPGRLADLVKRGEIHLDAVRTVVIDEADRMADMGFLPEVKRLLDLTPDGRQTLLFSATLDGDVDVLIKRYQQDPARHEVETPAEEVGDVRHLFWPIAREDRRSLTAELLRGTEPAIVFTRTKHGADRLAKQLRADGIRADAIHGDRSQRQRERALANLGEGKCTTLVATDVAARGIHVDNIALVVHYDIPATDKDYVHRSGRTGRAGATGSVVTLVTHEDHDAVDGIQRSLELPRGLHALDLDQLEAAMDPHPTISIARPEKQRPQGKRNGRNAQRRNGQGRRHGGSGSNNGNRNGNRSGNRNRNASRSR